MLSKTRTGGAYPAGTIHFVALQTWNDGDMMSTYIQGMTYHLRPGCERLHDLVFGEMGEDGNAKGGGWLAQGKIAISGVGPRGGGIVTASGQVANPATEGEG